PVDAPAAAKHMTEGHVEGPIVQSRRRLYGQVEVERPADVVEPYARVRDSRCVVGSARFDNEHLGARGGQFSRQDRAGRAGTHDDEVVLGPERSLAVGLFGWVAHCASFSVALAIAWVY